MSTYKSYLANLLTPPAPTDAVDLIDDTLKVACLTSGYIPDIAADEYWSDISADESSGTGYTAGGFTLVSKSILSSDTISILSGSVAEVANAAITDIRYVVLYKDTGTPATSPLIQFWDVGQQALVNQPLKIRFEEGVISTKFTQ